MFESCRGHSFFSVWRSLVARLLGVQKAAGSNPATLTSFGSALVEEGYNRPDWKNISMAQSGGPRNPTGAEPSFHAGVAGKATVAASLVPGVQIGFGGSPSGPLQRARV